VAGLVCCYIMRAPLDCMSFLDLKRLYFKHYYFVLIFDSN